MENNMQIYQSEKFGEIRTLLIDGEPWFVAADVCKALEIGNPADAWKQARERRRKEENNEH